MPFKKLIDAYSENYTKQVHSVGKIIFTYWYKSGTYIYHWAVKI
jgi:hypothetical protein